MELTDKQILVVGLGKSGAAAAVFLNDRGARVTVTDRATPDEIGSTAAEMQQMGIALDLGGHDPRLFESSDLIVLSPGVPHTLPLVANARLKGIPVIGEIELASRFIVPPIVAVTGTNGKTTVATLLGHMFRNAGMGVFVGGNIGAPLIGYVDCGVQADVIVAEVSSFQLDTIDTFSPHVGILLNVTDDHLDRYVDFKAYAAAKARLFENQSPEDTAVLNGADPAIREFCGQVQARRLWYRSPSVSVETPEIGAIVYGDRIACRLTDGTAAEFDLRRVKFTGRHNFENAAAACLGALAAGADPPGIQRALDEFTPPAHRLEWVAAANGVDYYNDSKATNVDAVNRALEGFDRPLILIMGGQDKGGNFRLLRDSVGNHVRKLLLLGEASRIIAASLADVTPTETVSSMERAVAAAAAAAEPGDAVLLSPGCASFDRYANYKQRGEAFKAAALKQVDGP